ncbi:MAG: MBL fold metallo-hydrolase [Clostridia bacterium]|nr:MBL fold metallo-hydrolase [Clostridia bacterium]
MKIYKYSVGPMGTNCYLLTDEATKKAAVVDPGDTTPDRILTAAADKGLTIVAILLTHSHFDHTLCLAEMRRRTGAPLLLHREEADLLHDNEKNLFARFSDSQPVFAPAERFLEEGDVIEIGQSRLTVLHTPGHTPGSVCYFDEEGGNVIAGDTLFRETVGRYDFPGGDYHTLMNSLAKLVKRCGNVDYKIYSGHGPATHISHELEHNLYLN